MIHFDPPVSVRPLSDVPPGALVRWGYTGENIGFCVQASNDPSSRKSLIAFDSQASQFKWSAALDDPNVVSYGVDNIVRPDIDTFAPSLAIQPDGTLYTLEGAPHLMLLVGTSPRFVNLMTGELYSKQGWPMVGGYRSWSVGVHGLGSQFIEALSVSPH